MHIKRYEAPTLQEALARVKRELGPDALILSSRTVKSGRGAFGLLSRSVVEVQAAQERGSHGSHEEVPNARRPGESQLDREGGAEPSLAPQARRSDDEWGRAEARREFEEEVRSELRGLRASVSSLLLAQPSQAHTPVARELSDLGLEAAHCTSLLAEFEGSIGSGAGRDLRTVLRDRLEAKLAPPREDEGHLVRVLVGAPGVGKTTTLAKLAARSEEGERDIALFSLDQFRIGGADQLRRYADLLDSPFEEISRAEEVKEAIGRFPGRSVLIDTAGRGRGAEERMASLLPLREQLGDRARIELVLDATARPEVQRTQLRRFAPLRPDRLILTKTDECDSLAPLANLILDEQCPAVCWMGTGQRVPEDLELARADEMVATLFGRAA